MNLSPYTSDKTILILRGLGFLMSIVSLLMLHVTRINDGISPLYDFQFFSTIIIWMLLLWYFMFFLWFRNPDNLYVLIGRVKGGLTSYILIVSLVYLVFSASNDNSMGLLAVVNIIHHYLIPIVFMIDHLLSSTRPFHWRMALEWLVFPLLYLAYAIVLGADSGTYVYFFLDINNPDIGIFGFLTWFLALVFLFWLIGIFVIAYNKKVIQNKMLSSA